VDGLNDFCSAQGELIETWMLLEYADRGSLEQAIGSGRFLKRTTRTLDMVGHHRPHRTLELDMLRDLLCP